VGHDYKTKMGRVVRRIQIGIVAKFLILPNTGACSGQRTVVFWMDSVSSHGSFLNRKFRAVKPFAAHALKRKRA
jgi:hypothetical protein